MSKPKEKPTHAVRNIKVKLYISYFGGIGIPFEYRKLWNTSDVLTDKLEYELKQQLIAKIKKMKVTLPDAVRCPDCEGLIDENEGKYRCNDCSITIKRDKIEKKQFSVERLNVSLEPEKYVTTINVNPLYVNDTEYSERQLESISEQISKQIDKLKFTLKQKLHCPICRKQLYTGKDFKHQCLYCEFRGDVTPK